MASTDAACSALANFTGSLIAIRVLDTVEFAAYSLFLSGMLASAVLPQFLAFFPHRLHTNKLIKERRGRFLADYADAIPYLTLGAVFVGVSAAPFFNELGGVEYLLIATTAVANFLLSPFQDHVRASMYVAGLPRIAAMMSVTNLAVVGIITSMLFLRDWDRFEGVEAVPFTALAIGNFTSLIIGLTLSRQHPAAESRIKLTPTLGLKVGASYMMIPASVYGTNILAAVMLGASSVAELEAARLAAQPVLVAGTAIVSVIGPFIIRDYNNGRHASAKKWAYRGAALCLIAGTLYALSLPFAIVPLSLLAGQSLGLALSSARAVAVSAQLSMSVLSLHLLGASRYRLATLSAAASSILGLAVFAVTAPYLGAYGVPVSITAGACVRWLIWSRWG